MYCATRSACGVLVAEYIRRRQSRNSLLQPAHCCRHLRGQAAGGKVPSSQLQTGYRWLTLASRGAFLADALQTRPVWGPFGDPPGKCCPLRGPLWVTAAGGALLWALLRGCLGWLCPGGVPMGNRLGSAPCSRAPPGLGGFGVPPSARSPLGVIAAGLSHISTSHFLGGGRQRQLWSALHQGRDKSRSFAGVG